MNREWKRRFGAGVVGTFLFGMLILPMYLLAPVSVAHLVIFLGSLCCYALFFVLMRFYPADGSVAQTEQVRKGYYTVALGTVLLGFLIRTFGLQHFLGIFLTCFFQALFFFFLVETIVLYRKRHTAPFQK